MVVNAIIRRIAAVLAAVSLSVTARALEMPPEVEAAFRKASVGEGGGLLTDKPAQREFVIDYVKANWRELLPRFEEIQVRGNNTASRISVIGVAAEELEPLEYLDFLDEYLSLVRQGKVPLRELVSQILGKGRKQYFIAVNFKHPRVKEVLAAAMRLYEERGTGLSADEVSCLEHLAEGRLAGSYVDEGSGRKPPETLPGSGGWRFWGIAAVLAVLAFAQWRAFFKRR